MSTEHGPQPPRPIEPLLTAVTEGVVTGYRGLELVVEGLRESLRLQAGSPARPSSDGPARPAAAFDRDGAPRRRSAPASAAGARSPAGLVQDLAAIVVEALGVAGTLVEDVAQAIGDQTHGGGGVGQECVPALALSARPDATASTTFTVWNTGPTLLTDVQLRATDLIGGGVHGPDTAVTFVPPTIPRIGPGKGEAVEISVSVPPDAQPGLCRGVVLATPGDACAVLELTVTAPPRHVVVEPGETDRPTGSTEPPPLHRGPADLESS